MDISEIDTTLVFLLLTHNKGPIAVISAPSRFAAATVVSIEPLIAQTSPFEEANRPKFPVVQSLHFILGSMRPGVHCDRHAAPTAHGKAAEVAGIWRPLRVEAGTTLSGSQGLWGGTLAGKLGRSQVPKKGDHQHYSMGTPRFTERHGSGIVVVLEERQE